MILYDIEICVSCKEIHSTSLGNTYLIHSLKFTEVGSKLCCCSITMLKAEFKYRQMKKEKKAEEMEAFNNIKLVRSLYGTAHCLKMEVIKEIDSSPGKNAPLLGDEGEDNGGGEADRGEAGGAGDGAVFF